MEGDDGKGVLKMVLLGVTSLCRMNLNIYSKLETRFCLDLNIVLYFQRSDCPSCQSRLVSATPAFFLNFQLLIFETL